MKEIKQTKSIGIISDDGNIIYLHDQKYFDFLSLEQIYNTKIIFTLNEDTRSNPIGMLKNKYTNINGLLKASEFIKENLNKIVLEN